LTSDFSWEKEQVRTANGPEETLLSCGNVSNKGLWWWLYKSTSPLSSGLTWREVNDPLLKLGFEFRASRVLGKCSTTWAPPPARLFLKVIISLSPRRGCNRESSGRGPRQTLTMLVPGPQTSRPETARKTFLLFKISK
jgi:hypothetical protein